MNYRIRKGNIVYELIEPMGDKNLKKGVIVFSGLPNQPRNEEFGENLAEQGFYVLQPRYMGNWESYGKFTLNNCIKTVIEAEKLMLSGKSVEVWGEKEITWKIDEVYLLSSSFGSAVVLSALPKVKTKNIICLCPLTNLNKHNTDHLKKEQDLSTLGGFIKRGFENAFRGFDEKDWLNFIKGNSKVNPIKYVDKIRDKNILLIHGEADTTINISRTEEFFGLVNNKNKIELKKYPGIGHGKKLRVACFNFILDWMKNN